MERFSEVAAQWARSAPQCRRCSVDAEVSLDEVNLRLIQEIGITASLRRRQSRAHVCRSRVSKYWMRAWSARSI